MPGNYFYNPHVHNTNLAAAFMQVTGSDTLQLGTVDQLNLSFRK